MNKKYFLYGIFLIIMLGFLNHRGWVFSSLFNNLDWDSFGRRYGFSHK